MRIINKLRKRGLAMFMALVLCLSLVQVTAFAEDETSNAPDPVDPNPVVLDIDLSDADQGADTLGVAPLNEASSQPTADDAADSKTEAADNDSLEPGQVKEDETLDEMTTPPDGFDENEGGSFTKTETSEPVTEKAPNGLKHTIQNTTEYEWVKVPIQDENGRLTGYTTTVYGTTSTSDTTTTRPSIAINVLEKEIAAVKAGSTDKTEFSDVVKDENGNILSYKKTTKGTDSAGNATIKVEEISYGEITEWQCKKTVVTTLTTTYPKQKFSEKTISIQQNEDGTITYQPSVSDNSSAPETSLVPDITTNNSFNNPNKNTHLWKPTGQTIAHVSPDFVYQWMGEFGPHSAIGINPNGVTDLTKTPNDLQYGGLVLLMDKDNHPHYVYCADMNTPQNPGTTYYLENLEDATHFPEILGGQGDAFSSEAATKVQTVALNGYWGKTDTGIGSLDYVKELLRASDTSINVDLLTPGMALAATQAAIWFYTNGADGINTEDPFNSKFLGGIEYYDKDDPGQSRYFTKEQEAVAKAYYDYLINHATLTEDQKVTTDIIKDTDIHDATITVRDLSTPATVDTAAIYNADVSFILDVEPARLNSDDLSVTLYDPITGEAFANYRLAGEENNGQDGFAKYDAESKTYILENVQLMNGKTVTLKLTGTQTVKQNAYLITATTGPASSQTFVAVEEGERKVDLSLNLHFSIKDLVVEPDPDPTPDPTPTPGPGPIVTPDPGTPGTPGIPGTTITDDQTPLAGSVGLNDTDHFAYVIGYEDDTVRPLNNITRAEAATIFFRLMTDEYRQANWSTTNSFSDVNAGDWYNNAVSTCANAGVLKGYEDGTFRPNAPITRAEFASMAAGFMDESITDDGTGDFSDTANHWAAVAIRRAAKAGWVTGSGNKFNPDAKITRAEVMTIVNRMLDRTPDKDHMLPEMKKWTDNPESEWYYEAVQEATNEHEYERDELNVETWTELLTERDWKALETEWANNGGASAPKADDTEAAQRMNRVPDGI